jgi:hypothetical protein
MAKKVGFSQLVIESDSDSESESGEEDASVGASSMTNSHLDEGSFEEDESHQSTTYSGSQQSGSLRSSVHSKSIGDSSLAYSKSSRGGVVSHAPHGAASHVSHYSGSGHNTDINSHDVSKGWGFVHHQQAGEVYPMKFDSSQFDNERIVLQNEIDSRNEIIQSMKNRISELERNQGSNKGMEDRISELENHLHDRDQRLSKLEGELYQCDQSRMRIQEESRKHMRRVTDLEGELAMLEKSKAQLNQIIKTQKETIDELEDKVFRSTSASAPVQYESLISGMKELRAKVKSLEAHRDSKHMMNEKLNKQIEEMSQNDERLHDVIAKCMRDIGVRNGRIEELTEQCAVLQQKLDEMADPESTIHSLQSAVEAAREELSSVQQKKEEEVGEREHTVAELKDQLLLLNMELDDQQRIIEAYTSDEDIIAVANCLKELRVRDKSFYDFFMAIVMWECNPQIPATDRGVVMDVKDAIRLIEKGMLSMRIVTKCQSRREQGAYLRHPPSMYGKPLWTDSVASPSKTHTSASTVDKIRQDNCDCAVRILDFMDQHQIMEVAKYLCSTPLLAEWAMAQQVLAAPPVQQKRRPGMCPYLSMLCRVELREL